MKAKKKRKTKIRLTTTSNVDNRLLKRDYLEYLKMQKEKEKDKFCPHCGRPYRREPLG